MPETPIRELAEDLHGMMQNLNMNRNFGNLASKKRVFVKQFWIAKKICSSYTDSRRARTKTRMKS